MIKNISNLNLQSLLRSWEPCLWWSAYNIYCKTKLQETCWEKTFSFLYSMHTLLWQLKPSIISLWHQYLTLQSKLFTNDAYLPPPSCVEESETGPPLDGVHLYAVELLSFSLIWHGFRDAIREGGGECIIRYWKLLHIIFRVSGHRNYSKEAVILLHQYNQVFSERQRRQLLWSCSVNTRGHQGASIPAD